MINFLKKEKTKAGYTLLLSCVLFIYILVRAFALEITVDEGTTYNLVRVPLIKVLLTTANTHWLNTFCVWLISFFTWEIEYWRLPNVVAFLFYARFSFLILKQYSASVFYFGIAILLCNPYFIDFFSLARGYGLALAFLLGSIYYLERSFLSNKNLDWLAAVSLGAFAVLSNYTLLFYFVAIGLLFLFITYSLKNHFKYVLYFFISSSVLAVLVNLYFIKFLGNDLIAGSNGQIYSTTIQSQFSSFLSIDLSNSILFFVSLLFFILIIACGTFFFYRKKLDVKVQVIFIVTILLILSHLFGVLYPVNRTALFYGILLSLFIIKLLNKIFHYLNGFAKSTISVCLVLLIWYNFLLSFNLKRTIEWPDLHETKLVLMDIEKDVIANKRNKSKVLFAAEWYHYNLAKSYYSTVYPTTYCYKLALASPDNYKKADYISISTINEKDVFNAVSCKIIKRYPESNKTLVKVLDK